MRLLIGLVGMLLLVAPARAAVESDLVKAGMAAYDDLEYSKALDLLDRALSETLTKEEKVATYKTMAFCHVALGKIDAARADFGNLLRADPRFELDRTISPRVRAVFEMAKTAVATGESGPAEVSKMPALQPAIRPAKPKEGQSITMSVGYPGGVAEKLQLLYRARGQAAYSKVQVAGVGGHFEVMLPGLQVKPPVVEYYLVLLDDTGASVASAGSLGQPLLLEVQAVQKPVYKKGWFWGVLGGVVAAGAIVAGVVVGTATTIGPNTPATLTIQPQ
jgi:hypothetical protein